MVTRVVSIDLVGRNLASGAFRSLSADAEKAAAKSAVAFDASTSRIGGAFSKLGATAAALGLPLAAGLTGVGTALERAETKGKSFGSTMSKVGGVELIAAGAGIALVGTSAVKAAGDFETSQAVLQTAVKNTGASFSAASGGISDLNDKFIKLGFNTATTEQALSVLVGATHNVATAEGAMAAAADIARARHLDLTTVSLALAKAAEGNYQILNRQGIASKEQTKNFHSLGDVLAYVTKIFGGQAVAYSQKFQGSLSSLGAEVNKLEVGLGEKLIPKIEGAASAAVAGAQGFEHANAATDGYLGKTIALGAALPVVVFASEKLVGGLAAAGTGISKYASGLTALVTGSGAAAAAEGEMTVAQSASAIAASKKLAAIASLASVEAVEAEKNAALVTANLELSAAYEADAAAAGVDAEATTALAAARRAVGVATAEANAATRTAVATRGLAAEAPGAGFAAAAGGMSLFIAAGLGVGAVLRSIGGSAQLSSKDLEKFSSDLLDGGKAADKAQVEFAKVLNPKGAEALSHYATLLVANASATDLNAAKNEVLQKSLAAIPGYLNDVRVFGKAAADSSGEFAQKVGQVKLEAAAATGKLKELAAQYGSGAIQQATLTAAQKQYRDDLASGSASTRTLTADRKAVTAAAAAQARTEDKVSAATERGTAAAEGASGALSANASAATKGAYAYLGLADSVKTAAQALDAINSLAFAPLTASISVDKAKAGLSDAISALTAPADTGGGGGGGGGQSATAAALDQAQKQLSVRDAYRSVASAASGVTDAETQLKQAQLSSTQAAEALKAAQESYRVTLHGVTADSKAAKAAQDALTSAQNAAAGGKLDVADARRALRQARADRPLTQFAVQDAQATLTKDQTSGASTEQIRKDQIALTDARIAASAGNEAVRRAELALSDALLASKGKTADAAKAQKDLNTTLHGYPPNSQEAKRAQEDLTSAQLAARQAAEGVTGAQQQLQAAQDNTATSALNLKRAQADLNGQLASSGGSGGGIGKAKSALESYKLKLDDVKAAAATFAESVGKSAGDAGHGLAFSLRAEIAAIQGIVDAEPLLAAAYDPILASIQAKLSAELRTNPPNITAFQHPKRTRASGGPVEGTDPTGIPILAHPREFVMQAKAVDKYGLKAMSAMNAGKLDLPKFAAGGPVDGMRAYAQGGPVVNIPHPVVHHSSVSRGGDTYHVHLHGPVMGENVEDMIESALQNITRKKGSVQRVRTSY